MQVSLAAWPMVASVWKNQNTCETKNVSQPSLPTEDKASIVWDTLELRHVWKWCITNVLVSLSSSCSWEDSAQTGSWPWKAPPRSLSWLAIVVSVMFLTKEISGRDATQRLECLLREAVGHYRKVWLAMGAENTSFSLTGIMQGHGCLVSWGGVDVNRQNWLLYRK